MANALYLNQYITTTLSVAGGINDSQTTDIVLASTASLDTTKPGMVLLNYDDPLDTSKAEWVEYSSINSSTKALEGVVRGSEGFSAKAHDNGVAIAFPLSESHINRLNDKLLGLDTGVILDDLELTGTPTFDSEASAVIYKNSLYENLIINSNFDVWQRGTAFVAGANNDDVYTADHWNLISDGNDAVDVSQAAITDLPGSNYAIKLDTETAKRYGIVQFIEAKDAQKLKGKYVSLSFKVKSANISALRAAILSWGSTADSITSDIVASWDATPTWAANWTAENTPADLTVTSDWTTVKIENIYIDSATVNNLAVAIWTPSEETIGDIVYISQVKVNEGSKATVYSPKSFEEELRACMRYFEKSHDYAVAPAVAEFAGCVNFRSSAADQTDRITVKFSVPKRTTPDTVSLYGGAGTGKIYNASITSDKGAAVALPGTNGFIVYPTENLTIGGNCQFGWIAIAEL